MNALTSTAPPRRSQHATLIALAAVFLLPFIAGSALFWSGWRPAKSTPHGELLAPPRPLPASGLQLADDRELPTAELRGKWLIALPLEGACNDDCLTSLKAIAQLHEALGKEQSRVKPILIADGSRTRTEDLSEVRRRFPTLTIAAVASNSEAWEMAFAGRDAGLFIVDPFCNVMMRYRGTGGTNEMRGVLKDLERLLKYAWTR